MNFKQHKTSLFESNDDLRLSEYKLHFLPLLLSSKEIQSFSHTADRESILECLKKSPIP